MDMASFARACVDFGQNIRNLRITKSSSPAPTNNSSHDNAQTNSSNGFVPNSPLTSRSGNTVAAIKQRLFNQGLKIDLHVASSNKKTRKRYKEYMYNKLKEKADCKSVVDMAKSPWFLKQLVKYLPSTELMNLCSVCSFWRDQLYQESFWSNLQLAFYFRVLKDNIPLLSAHCSSLSSRNIDSAILYNFTDDCLSAFLSHIATREKVISSLVIYNSSVSDCGLATLIDSFTNLTSLKLISCNDLSEIAFWSCLSPKLTALTILDCINISDESVAALTQLLPNLTFLELQGYHITDNALSYFTSRPNQSLSRLRLNSCWEVSNHGIVNLAAGLSHLQELSLSGCSKLTDDAVDVLTEHLKQLRMLDLSWCQKLTDVSLECIACDLSLLEILHLDRCSSISDIGIGYLSTMPLLRNLMLRWCAGLSDNALRHTLNMRSLRSISLAGIVRMTGDGLCSLVRLDQLQCLELTNCRGASLQVCHFLSLNLPNCTIIF